MSKPKQKYYVVWKGREPGIYFNWDECKAQVHGYPQARYKSFTSLKLAEKAFSGGSTNFVKFNFETGPLTREQRILIGEPILDSISVDASWNTKTGVVEYQGVHTDSLEVIFRIGPFEDGTINIVEFLAIVHGLAHCKKNNLNLPIYSDSTVAIGWVKNKRAATNHERSENNKKLFELLDRAEKWLQENDFANPLLKWETKAWSENPADFGRK